MRTSSEPQAGVITLGGDTFRIHLTASQISQRVGELAGQINRDLPDTPIFIGVLTGGFVFLSDLVRATGRDCEVDFIKVSSYGDGQTSSGSVRQHMGLSLDITGRDVVVVEDIIDTGLSMTHLINHLSGLGPSSISVATFLHKPAATRYPLELNYVGFTIPNHFVVGYGLDFAQVGRNLPHLYIQTASTP